MNAIISALVILVLLSASFNLSQQQNINELTEQLNQTNEQVNKLTQDKNRLTEEISTITYKLNNLDSKAKNYLKAEGRACDKEAESCLSELTERLTAVTGPDCSGLSDGVCPSWCAAGADYDCCNLKNGYAWVQGRGCYIKQ